MTPVTFELRVVYGSAVDRSGDCTGNIAPEPCRNGERWPIDDRSFSERPMWPDRRAARVLVRLAFVLDKCRQIVALQPHVLDIGAPLDRLDGVTLGSVRGDDDDPWRGGATLADFPEQLETVHARHAQVGDDQVEC